MVASSGFPEQRNGKGVLTSMGNEDFLSKPKLLDLTRYHVNTFVKEVAASLPDGSLVLDAGAGESAYRRLFARCDYKAIDLGVGDSKWDYRNLDYIGPLDDMPIDSEMFDAVVCTQVLEHLEWPRESVAEMYRVLKPGGRLFITVPMSHGEHQVPYDFFRYTSYGLRSICTHAGFAQVDVKPFGGSYVRWAHDLPVVLLPSLLKRPKLAELGVSGVILYPFKLLLRVLLLPVQMGLLWLDRFDTKKDHPFGWRVVAQKPEPLPSP
ncbi:class I SAM-dependent methyltransferase [uncultured Thiodictyon sp.]|uniref:class I SAM-dependent methyltransferase n=1 Tax=uncultured Thiodictyon sp. TaxID=1846217 RepID=UPI0025F5E5E5|nr:class I SAM-dependent methyltransferase [uncultured Thiodictyon sp.]